MNTYISILRGINVSGTKLIKMEALRALYEKLGFQNIISYIQSGNLIFLSPDTNPKELAYKITGQIEREYGFKVPALVMRLDELAQIINENPFAKDKDEKFLHVTFLASPPSEFDVLKAEQKKQNREEVVFTNHAVYLFCPGGYGNTKLTNNFFENLLGVKATTRNWKTAQTLLELAKKAPQ